VKTISKNLKILGLALSLASSLLGTAQAETLKKSDAKSAVVRTVPVVVNLGAAPIGSRRKIENGKGDELKQQPVAGIPTREGPAPERNSLLGTAISLDPSARPDLAGFQRKVPGDVFGGVDARLSRGTDGKAKLQEMMQSLFNLLGEASETEEGELQPGDTPYGNADSMFGADAGQKKSGATGTTVAPSTYDEEGLHAADGGKTAESYKGTTLGNVGTALGNGLPSTPTGQALQQAMDQIKSDSNGDAAKDDKPKDAKPDAGTEPKNNEPKVTTSSDGNVTKFEYPDGTVAVRNETNGTTTTLYKDGSTKTTKNGTGEVIDETPPTTSIPDSDHQGVPLPAQIQKQLDADLEALRAIGPKKEPGNVDPGEGSEAGSPVGTVDEDAAIPDKKSGIINPGSPEVETHPRPSVNQGRPSLGPDETVIHYE